MRVTKVMFERTTTKRSRGLYADGLQSVRSLPRVGYRKESGWYVYDAMVDGGDTHEHKVGVGEGTRED